MIRAFNLLTDEVQEFCHDDAVAAVVSAYCEEQGLMSWLTQYVMEPAENNPRHNPQAFKPLKAVFTYGRQSVCCGNWAATL